MRACRREGVRGQPPSSASDCDNALSVPSPSTSISFAASSSTWPSRWASAAAVGPIDPDPSAPHAAPPCQRAHSQTAGATAR